MIIKTRSLIESLEKKYGLDEAYEYETDDELDYIMDDDSLSDEEKEKSIDNVLVKYDKENSLNETLVESFVKEWWGQTEEDPFKFAKKYNLGCTKLSKRNDEILYRFSGDVENFNKAMNEGYFYSVSIGEDEGHSEDLNPISLSEGVDDQDFQWFVGDIKTGYMYPNEERSLEVVKQLIDIAKQTEGCEIISIVVVPQDGAGNDLS